MREHRANFTGCGTVRGRGNTSRRTGRNARSRELSRRIVLILRTATTATSMETRGQFLSVPNMTHVTEKVLPNT